MLLDSGQVNKIWSDLLPGYLILFYSEWLGDFTEVGSAGSRVSSGFVSSCVSPSWLATAVVSPRGWELRQKGVPSSEAAQAGAGRGIQCDTGQGEPGLGQGT